MLAAQLNDVWKRYYIKYDKRSSFKEAFWGFLRGTNRRAEFWALKNICLEVKKGEALGIIGKNGSGKTTLLKLLCGITKATKGSIRINGKVAGLLELGAGFQGDLTGKENIYLNGSILGLSRKGTQEKIDSIIDFADIGDFIDAQVRTYSAGMYLRLGFAIAIELDPDILLIDEVLAVGDETFQEKCLNKIREFKKEGKTIIVVSHNLNIIRQLCENTILMDKGSVISNGYSQVVINRYMSLIGKEEMIWPTKEVEITNVYFKDNEGKVVNRFRSGEELRIIIEYFAHKKIENPVFGIGIYKDDIYLIGPNTRDNNYKISYVENKGILEYIIEHLPFSEGEYKVSVSIHNMDETRFYDYHEHIYEFQVIPGKKEIKYGLFGIENANWNKVN